MEPRYLIFGMNKILASKIFIRKVKPLSKKYHSLKESIENLGKELLNNPYLGESYGNGIYKIRLADESKGKGKGKRGGFRILYYLAIEKAEGITIVLITIINKSEVDTIKKKDAEMLLR